MESERARPLTGAKAGCGCRCAHAFHFDIPGCLACPGAFRMASKPCYEPAPAGLPCRPAGRREEGDQA